MSLLSKSNPHIDIVLATLIWGSNGIFIKYLDLPVVTISFFRLSVPTIFLFVLLSLRGVKLFKGNNKLALVASFLHAIRMFLYLVAFTFTSIGNAILIHYTYPIFVAIFESKYLKEGMSKKAAWLLGLAFIGIMFMFINSEISFASKDFIGMMAMLFAAALYAVTIVIFKKVSEKYSSFEKVFYQNVVGAIIFLPFLFILPLPSFEKVSIATLYGLIIGVVGFALFFSGLKKIKASTASFICYLEVVSAMVFAYIFFFEVPTWNMVVGGLLIITSTVLLSRGESSKIKVVKVA